MLLRLETKNSNNKLSLCELNVLSFVFQLQIAFEVTPYFFQTIFIFIN